MNLLDILLILPAAGFLITLFLPKDNPGLIRNFVMGVSVITFLFSLLLIGPVLASPGRLVLEGNSPWIEYPAIRYHVALDGLSLWLVVLSTFLTPIVALVSWKYIQNRVKEFYAFLLALLLGVLGVFIAQDLFLFFVFWEISLVPMYFLVGIWGHDKRIYAALKFFLYTMAGSALAFTAK